MPAVLHRPHRNPGERGDWYYEYRLDLDPEIVLDVRNEIEPERDQ